MKKYILCSFIILLGFSIYAQQKIGDKPTTINQDALLELESTKRGLLLPRIDLVATNQAAPLKQHVAGMTVYNIGTNIASGYYYNDGSAWQRLATAAGNANNLYNTDGKLTGTRKVDLNSYNLIFEGAGNVGIGTTNDPNYKLHVNGSIASTSAFFNLSDSRLKVNLHPLEGALDKVMKLKGITFDWNHSVDSTKNLDNKNHIGFIAQDVEKVFPQVVMTADDLMKTKSVAYSDLIPVLVEAIKELKVENDRLKLLIISQNKMFEARLKVESEK